MKRLFLWLLVLCLFVGGYAYKNPRLILRIKDTLIPGASGLAPQNAIISLSYLLQRDQWTEFLVPVSSNRLKILTNSILPSEMMNATEDTVFQYAIDYKLLDAANNKVLRDGRYHFISKVSLHKSIDDNKQKLKSFFSDNNVIPADGRMMFLDLEEFSPLTKNVVIRLREASKDLYSKGIISRVYSRLENPLKKQQVLWKRLSNTQKKNLSKGNLYPYDLLNKTEIENIVKQQWQPMGPSGIPNRDFNIRRLYILKETVEMIQPENRLEDQKILTLDNKITFAIPEEGKTYQLKFTKISKERLSGYIHLSWFGPTIHDELHLDIPIENETNSINHFFSGGIVELKSNLSVEVNILDPENADQDIFPEPLFSKMYLLEPGKNIEYAIKHLDEQPVPTRITVRSVNTETDQIYQLKYKLYSDTDSLIAQNTLDSISTPSLYDQPTGIIADKTISDPTHVYLTLPPGAKRIVLESKLPQLVSLANYPPGLVQRINVPEDYYQHSFHINKQPFWFSYPPLDDLALQKQKRSVLIRIQHRPPERNQEIAAGNFLWESFRPNDKWAGNYILVPRNKTSPERTESSASLFQKLTTEKTIQKTFIAQEPKQFIWPKLIFQCGASKTGHLKLNINNHVYIDRPFKGKNSIIQLPAVPSGHASLIAEITDGCDLYLSNLAETSPGYILRFANKLDTRGLSFNYLKKTAEETLSFMYFSPCDSTGRANVTIKLRGSTDSAPHQSFTKPFREYSVRPGGEPLLQVLNSDSQCVQKGEKLYLPLGNDLPPGTYPVTINNSTSGFIIIYRVLPGKFNQSKFLREAS